MHRWIVKMVCLIALAACAPLAHAQVFHCIGAHGEPVFSGQPCGTPAGSPAGTASAAAMGATCPASPDALRQAIGDAFQARDVNLLAGLIDWRGTSQTFARATLRALAAWLQQPLAGIASVLPMQPWPYRDSGAVRPGVVAAASSAPPPAPIGFEVSTGGGDGSTRDFGVTQSEGCWWLTF